MSETKEEFSQLKRQCRSSQTKSVEIDDEDLEKVTGGYVTTKANVFVGKFKSPINKVDE